MISLIGAEPLLQIPGSSFAQLCMKMQHAITNELRIRDLSTSRVISNSSKKKKKKNNQTSWKQRSLQLIGRCDGKIMLYYINLGVVATSEIVAFEIL